MRLVRTTLGIIPIAAISLSVSPVFIGGAFAESEGVRTNASCAEGFEQIENNDIAKEQTYECRRILRCESGWTAIGHEIVEEDGKIVQRYTCSRPNTGLILNVDAAKENMRDDITENLFGADDD